jgi:ABC-type nitrate/sulfonate/bicarbonate transport system ATPase subunit
MKPVSLHVRGLSAGFGGLKVLDEVAFSAEPGSLVALVGPSGCGKSTLLRILAGRHRPSAGSIEGHASTLTLHQETGLFPWLSVEENLAIGRREGPELDAFLEDCLRSSGLEAFRQHYPRQLSGGMRRKVEAVRAFRSEAPLLLMDEPFSALDALSRRMLHADLRRLLKEIPKTVLLVTHDLDEALDLADRVIVLSPRPARVLEVLETPGRATAAQLDRLHSLLGVEL